MKKREAMIGDGLMWRKTLYGWASDVYKDKHDYIFLITSSTTPLKVLMYTNRVPEFCRFYTRMDFKPAHVAGLHWLLL